MVLMKNRQCKQKHSKVILRERELHPNRSGALVPQLREATWPCIILLFVYLFEQTEGDSVLFVKH